MCSFSQAAYSTSNTHATAFLWRFSVSNPLLTLHSVQPWDLWHFRSFRAACRSISLTITVTMATADSSSASALRYPKVSEKLLSCGRFRSTSRYQVPWSPIFEALEDVFRHEANKARDDLATLQTCSPDWDDATWKFTYADWVELCQTNFESKRSPNVKECKEGWFLLLPATLSHLFTPSTAATPSITPKPLTTPTRRTVSMHLTAPAPTFTSSTARPHSATVVQLTRPGRRTKMI